MKYVTEPNEPKKYLMRHSERDEKEKLERIFRNSLTDYVWYIRRRDFNPLEELVELAEDLEDISIAISSTSHREQHQMISTRN